MHKPSSEISSSSICTVKKPSNTYNPSTGNFQPYVTEELEDLIKSLKIDSIDHVISDDNENNILIAVINCLLYHHLNSKDIKILKNFLFDFNQKIFDNPLEKETVEDLWIQETSFIQYNIDVKNPSFITILNIIQKHIQQSISDLLHLELDEDLSKGLI